jgi:hypothetical protein
MYVACNEPKRWYEYDRGSKGVVSERIGQAPTPIWNKALPKTGIPSPLALPLWAGSPTQIFPTF